MKEISVVIPTYNRSERLSQTLAALAAQTLGASRYEVIIVDDGSSDGTGDMVSTFAKNVPFEIRYLWQENQFVGAARNRGILEARSNLVLLMDSDIVPNKDHLSLHLSAHKEHNSDNVAVLGQIVSPDNTVDLIRDRVEYYQAVGKTRQAHPELSKERFVTADISLKRSFLLRAGLFTEGIPVVEDMDLAWRLAAEGMVLLQSRNAIAIHMEPLDSIEKVIREGRRYGTAIAEHFHALPFYKRELSSLGARFNGGWNQLRQDPLRFAKDAIARACFNRLTIGPVTSLARRLPRRKPPSALLSRLAIEIWAYHYRAEFRLRRLPKADSAKTVLTSSAE
jgi:glycosyltransferase involved in cell wall biosynthesis